MVVELFLREKNVKVLLLLRDRKTRWYVSLLAKRADITYPHAAQLIPRLEEKEIVRTVREGRTRYVELTPLGEEIAVSLENVYRQLKRIEGNSS